jgi:hypothetical protein
MVSSLASSRSSPSAKRQALARKIAATLEVGHQRVFMANDLGVLLEAHREEWKLGARVRGGAFLDLLEEQVGMRRVVLKGATHSQEFTRYLWGEASPAEVASSLRASAYLTHSSAVFVHGLTEQLPKVFYVNYEQSAKPKSKAALTQEGMDRAFRGKQRESSFAFEFDDYRIVMLSGKNTKRLEVQSAFLPGGGKVDVTSLERTLIDIAVRPTYAGGVHQVLEAYRGAREQVSVGKLIAVLKQMDYVYPYHQAIGFYLDRAGVGAKQLERVRALGTELRFYLAHGMREMEFNEKWQLHHPKGM